MTRPAVAEPIGVHSTPTSQWNNMTTPDDDATNWLKLSVSKCSDAKITPYDSWENITYPISVYYIPTVTPTDAPGRQWSDDSSPGHVNAFCIDGYANSDSDARTFLSNCYAGPETAYPLTVKGHLVGNTVNCPKQQDTISLLNRKHAFLYMEDLGCQWQEGDAGYVIGPGTSLENNIPYSYDKSTFSCVYYTGNVDCIQGKDDCVHGTCVQGKCACTCSPDWNGHSSQPPQALTCGSQFSLSDNDSTYGFDPGHSMDKTCSHTISPYATTKIGTDSPQMVNEAADVCTPNLNYLNSIISTDPPHWKINNAAGSILGTLAPSCMYTETSWMTTPIACDATLGTSCLSDINQPHRSGRASYTSDPFCRIHMTPTSLAPCKDTKVTDGDGCVTLTEKGDCNKSYFYNTNLTSYNCEWDNNVSECVTDPKPCYNDSFFADGKMNYMSHGTLSPVTPARYVCESSFAESRTCGQCRYGYDAGKSTVGKPYCNPTPLEVSGNTCPPPSQTWTGNGVYDDWNKAYFWTVLNHAGIGDIHLMSNRLELQNSASSPLDPYSLDNRLGPFTFTRNGVQTMCGECDPSCDPSKSTLNKFFGQDKMFPCCDCPHPTQSPFP